METLLENPIVSKVILAAVGLVTALLSAVLLKMFKKASIDIDDKQEAQVKGSVQDSIAFISQTLVKNLRVDGKLDIEGAKKALDETVKIAKQKLVAIGGKKAKELMADDQKLIMMIESNLPVVKKLFGKKDA